MSPIKKEHFFTLEINPYFAVGKCAASRSERDRDASNLPTTLCVALRAGAWDTQAYSAVVPTSQRVGTKAGLYKHTTRVAWQAASLLRQKRSVS